MTLSTVLSVTTFKSSSGGQRFWFDLAVTPEGIVELRNLRTDFGLIRDPVTGVPQSVLDDIQDAKEIVRQKGAETQVASGVLTFNGVTSVPASILAGVLNNTAYRVAYTTPDGTVLRTTGKTTTGFTAEAPAVYGSVLEPIDVDYVVLVAADQASTTGGTLTFVQADNGVKSVLFAQALTTSNYRVVLTPSDFFTARVRNQKKTGFDVVLGFSLGAVDMVDVGYDVFVG